MSYTLTQIHPSDRRGNEQVDALLRQEGIRRDANLDYTCGLMDEDYRLIATGSCFGSTLRCFAVDRGHQGEGLLNEVVTHLINVQAERVFIFSCTPSPPPRCFSVISGSMKSPAWKTGWCLWRTGRTALNPI